MRNPALLGAGGPAPGQPRGLELQGQQDFDLERQLELNMESSGCRVTGQVPLSFFKSNYTPYRWMG